MESSIRERAICSRCNGKGVIKHDLSGKEFCSRCFGVGTIPAPLEDDELGYDRGELMAEAFAAGGYQGWYDMQDEWREYRSQTGSHADPLQRQIEANWAREHTPYQDPYEY